MNTSGVYLRLHLGDPSYIRSPAFNRVNTECLYDFRVPTPKTKTKKQNKKTKNKKKQSNKQTN